MAATPLITILLPTYSRAKYLPSAIGSALAQTYAHFELLVLDDASPDDGATAAAVAPFLADPRVHYIRHAKNRGIASNWRYGIAAAKGDFFCILHDDDTFEPEFLKALLGPLQNDPHCSFAFCDHWLMSTEDVRLPADSDDASRRFGRDRLSAGLVANLKKVSLIDLSLPVGATLFRRSLVNPEMISDQAKGAIDYWLFYQIVRTGATAYYVSQRLMNYRVHPGGMSSSQPIYMAEGQLFRLSAALSDPAVAEVWPELKKQRADFLTSYGIALLRHNRSADARSALSKAVSQHPNARAAVALLLSLIGSVGCRIARRLKSGPVMATA